MAESAVSFLLAQLSTLVRQEKELLGGLRHEVEYIRDQLQHMNALLRVADAKEESDPRIKEWVRLVRELAYDIEDVLDMYVLRFTRPGGRGNRFSRTIKKLYSDVRNLKARHEVALEIQTIKSRLQNLFESLQTIRDAYPILDQSLSSTFSSNTWSDCRYGALFLEEADVVGIEKPKGKLLDWILTRDHEYGLSVISVVGIGGLGKTTLVKKVYDDTTMQSKFDHHIWVIVSETLMAENLFRDMIKQLVAEVKQPPPQGFETMTVVEMIKFITEFLEHKRYVVVLDDVWRTDAWDAIKYAFPKRDSHGCIIITTRSKIVANVAFSESNGFVFELEPLPQEESKKLFYRKAFHRNSCPQYLEIFSENILKKCSGLPLAIVVIGGLLATKNNRIEDWEMFSRNIGDELEGDNLMKIKKSLSLGYNDLPYYLKTCFLYLSFYPEDTIMDKDDIVRLWMAEGFLQTKHSMTMEEVAEGYLNELTDRSLIQVYKTYSDGSPREFEIHDLLREYITKKSREQNIFTIFCNGEARGSSKMRRLATHTPMDRTQAYFLDFKYLRTVLWPGMTLTETEIISGILGSDCRLLKVLLLGAPEFNTIPSQVFKLYHLKYLAVRLTEVQEVPKSIGNLKNLETLDLSESSVTVLPIEILKLRKLRHLIVYKLKEDTKIFDGYQGFKAPYEIGSRLLSLQTLDCIDIDDRDGNIKTVREIGKLIQLRCLCIGKLRKEDGRELCSSLAKLHNLRVLEVHSIEEGEVMDLDYLLSPAASTFPFLQSLGLEGCLTKVPQWIPSLHSLRKLFLRWSRLQVEDPVEGLQNLPNLIFFEMYCAYEGKGLSFKAGGFPMLKKLRLKQLEKLIRMRVEKGSMPLLEDLALESLKLLADVPEGIDHLTNLKKVDFSNMGEEFVEMLDDQYDRGGEIWKLAHVPDVKVWNLVDGKWQKARDFSQDVL